MVFRFVASLFLLAGLTVSVGAQTPQSLVRGIDADRAEVDRSLRRHRVVEQDFLEFSTEGGSLKAYLDGDVVRKIAATFYGHMLRSEDEYYYDKKGTLVYASRRVARYAEPLPAPVRITSRDTNRFYLHKGKIIRWVSGRSELKTDEPRVFTETEDELIETSDFLLEKIDVAVSSQAGKKTLASGGPHVRRACIESPDIHVGDSFEKTSAALPLQQDPTDAEVWTAPGPTLALDDTQTLRSTVRCRFDVRQRLRSLSVVWSYDGARTAEAKSAIVSALLGRVHTCLKSQKLVESPEGRSTARIDYGTYSEQFVFETTPDQRWHIAYTVSEEP